MSEVRKIVTFKELKSKYGIPYGRTHIQRLEDADKFPGRIIVGEGRIGWYEDEIIAWVNNRPRG